jgi:signal transduction histidine kinase
MSHEVNNSLAPITSLMHSARMLSRGSELEPKLQRVFDTVEERARHLTSFLDGYASFARLPTPQPRAVEWKRFLGSFARLYPQLRLGPVPEGAGWFDEAQLSQVLINLVKNAQEAGGPPEAIELEVTPLDGGWKVAVLDRGRGVSAEVAQHALLPFYTTKERGSGLGLALCRDVVEAHQGSIRLEPRDGGGAAAVLWLPPETKRDALTESRARLTITRA